MHIYMHRYIYVFIYFFARRGQRHKEALAKVEVLRAATKAKWEAEHAWYIYAYVYIYVCMYMYYI